MLKYPENLSKRLFSEKKEVDCSIIELVQNDAINPCSIKGPGYLKADSRGQISVKIFNPQITNPPAHPVGWSSGTPGKVYPKNRYFLLKAVDQHQGVWTSEKVVPRSSDSRATSITGQLLELRCTENFSTDELVEPSNPEARSGNLSLYFQEDIAIPSNSSTVLHRSIESCDGHVRPFDKLRVQAITSDVLRFSVMDCDFTFNKVEGGFEVHVSSNNSLPSHLDIRVQESLQFMLGKAVYWKVYRFVSGDRMETRVRSVFDKTSEVRHLPPLYFPSRCDLNAKHVTNLFSRYFEFTANHGSDWHPCTIHLFNAIMASSSSDGAYALALSVAIEGVCRTQYKEVASPCPEDLALLGGVTMFLKNLPQLFKEDSKRIEAEKLLGRIEGSLSGLKNSRPFDQLIALSKLGAIEKGHAHSWRDLRNKSTHADAFDPIKAQKHANSRLSAIVLLYHLIFYKIGYEGFYNDYSEPGFPEKYYQPANIGGDPPI